MPPIRTVGVASAKLWLSMSRNETKVTMFRGRSFTSIGESA